MYEKYVGKRFNRLVVLSDGEKRYYVKCECDCGKIKEQRLNLVKGGYSKSCGCLHKEKVSIKKYDDLDKNFRQKYKGIRQRCTDVNYKLYKDYGGRGIKCEWEKFSQFYSDMYGQYKEFKRNNDYVSIDRIDVNGNYCKENCRFADRKTQNRNKRNVRQINIRGEKLIIPEIVEKYFTYKDIKEKKSIIEKTRWRINKGWKGEDLLLVHKYPKNN